jgi:hypothetical protein
MDQSSVWITPPYFRTFTPSRYVRLLLYLAQYLQYVDSSKNSRYLFHSAERDATPLAETVSLLQIISALPLQLRLEALMKVVQVEGAIPIGDSKIRMQAPSCLSLQAAVSTYLIDLCLTRLFPRANCLIGSWLDHHQIVQVSKIAIRSSTKHYQVLSVQNHSEP